MAASWRPSGDLSVGASSVLFFPFPLSLLSFLMRTTQSCGGHCSPLRAHPALRSSLVVSPLPQPTSLPSSLFLFLFSSSLIHLFLSLSAPTIQIGLGPKSKIRLYFGPGLGVPLARPEPGPSLGPNPSPNSDPGSSPNFIASLPLLSSLPDEVGYRGIDVSDADGFIDRGGAGEHKGDDLVVVGGEHKGGFGIADAPNAGGLVAGDRCEDVGVARDPDGSVDAVGVLVEGADTGWAIDGPELNGVVQESVRKELRWMGFHGEKPAVQRWAEMGDSGTKRTESEREAALRRAWLTRSLSRRELMRLGREVRVWRGRQCGRDCRRRRRP
ncbi:uncharacterized protein [Elaeis guineensis]|uniref:uncharacterized protein n=1 Tax=Elaeis guineensis var. tenera TaxID=51953 RepID=UPI003C6D82E7